jgi:hypothetical protein
MNSGEPVAQHRYRLFGLRVASEVELPELLTSSDEGPADVEIAYGAVAELGPDEPDGLTVMTEGALLKIPKVGRFWMSGGRNMAVDPALGASLRNVRLYLLGSAFAAILHQRSILPLHANAIVVDGQAIAFMGHSGAGKSTMAAWFHDCGFPVLADDVCAVTFDEAGVPIAHPGIPRLRLWREALEASGRTAEGYEMSFDDMDKYNVPISEHCPREGVPLNHVYLLQKAGEDEAGGCIEPLRGMAALEALVANTYRGGFLPLMKGTGRHMLQCAELARKVRVYRAERKWGLDVLDAQGRLIEEHARRLIAASIK